MELTISHKNKEYIIIIDDEDYSKIKELKLYIQNDHRFKKRVMSKNGVSLYRFIMKTTSNQICIHKNNNQFDFRKENLLILSMKELKALIKEGKIKPRYDKLNRVYYEFENI